MARLQTFFGPAAGQESAKPEVLTRKSRFFPPHTGQSSAAVAGFAFVTAFLAAVRFWPDCAASAKTATDRNRTILEYRMNGWTLCRAECSEVCWKSAYRYLLILLVSPS